MAHGIALALVLATGIVLPTGNAGDCNGNGVADAVEMSAKPHLDTNGNGVLDFCEGLSVDRDELSVSAGGVQKLHLELGPTMAGSFYWVLGSLAGTSPGMKVGFAHLPLNWDGPGAYMGYTLVKVNSGYLKNGLGALDAYGRADATFELPPGTDPGLAGLTVRHAYLVLGPDFQTFVWASNAVALRLDP